MSDAHLQAEIQDETTQFVLPAKFKPEEAAVAESSPEFLFSGGLVSAQCAGTVFEMQWRMLHEPDPTSEML